MLPIVFSALTSTSEITGYPVCILPALHRNISYALECTANKCRNIPLKRFLCEAVHHF